MKFKDPELVWGALVFGLLAGILHLLGYHGVFTAHASGAAAALFGLACGNWAARRGPRQQEVKATEPCNSATANRGLKVTVSRMPDPDCWSSSAPVCSLCSCDLRFEDDKHWFAPEETPGDHGALCEPCFVKVVTAMPVTDVKENNEPRP